MQAAQMAEMYGITPDAVLGEMKRITAEEDDAGEKCPHYGDFANHLVGYSAISRIP